jgi:hypothetical protein
VPEKFRGEQALGWSWVTWLIGLVKDGKKQPLSLFRRWAGREPWSRGVEVGERHLRIDWYEVDKNWKGLEGEALPKELLTGGMGLIE